MRILRQNMRMRYKNRSVNSQDALGQPHPCFFLSLSLSPSFSFLHQGCTEDWWCLTLNRTSGAARYWQRPARLVALINERHQLLITRLARNCNPQRNRTISYRTGGFTSGRAIYASGMITGRAAVLGTAALRIASAARECFAYISSKGMWRWWRILRNRDSRKSALKSRCAHGKGSLMVQYITIYSAVLQVPLIIVWPARTFSWQAENNFATNYLYVI